MRDWNVVVTTHRGQFGRAQQLLKEMGNVGRTDYYNVLVMRVDDVEVLLERLEKELSIQPELASAVAHIRPAHHAFDFQTPAEFEARAREIVLRWVPELASKGFHVRLHRRGFKGRLSSPDEELFLDGALLEALADADTRGHLSYRDPDAVIAVDTVSNRAGMALWTRDALRRYAFLGLA
jgi:tRNA(Ser,Leu) C12 N-acetylase TAN1